MNFQPMRFKEYQWPHNPETIIVEQERELKQLTVPFSGITWQDYGCSGRVVTGEGEFFGPGCAEEYAGLEKVMAQDGPGLLVLPNLPPFSARFVSLRLTGKSEPQLLHYQFVFREETTQATASNPEAPGGIYLAQEGENLWDIAALYATSVELLLEWNPSIQWPNWLTQGQEVAVP